MPRILNSEQITDGSTALPVAAGAVYISEPGTTTEKTVYSDEAETVTVSQPIALDSEGRIATALYATGKFRLQVYDATDTGSRDGVLVRDDDNLRGAGVLGAEALTAPLLADDSTSTANPVYSFDGDTDTGIARPATDELAGVVGGSEGWRLDAAGNFGVGTSTPTEKGEFDGNLLATGIHYSSTGTFTVTATGTTTEVISGLDGGAVYLVTYSCFGTDMQVLLVGVVVTGGIDTIVQVNTIRGYDFNTGSVLLQTKGNATGATFSSGNGNAFQFVCTGDGAADRTARYRLLRLL